VSGDALPEALRAQLAGIVSASMDAILTSEGADRRVSLFNRAAEEIFGYAAAEAIGKPLESFLPDLFDEAPRQVCSGLPRRFEAIGMGRNGHRMALQVSLAQTGTPLHPIYSVLAREIVGRRRMEDELRSRADYLRRVDQEKNAFIALLAHELRNPLAPIPAVVALLRQLSAPGDWRVALAHDIIDRQVGRLVRLVDDLLEVSRLMHEEVSLCRVPLDLMGVIGQAIDACRPLIEQRSCRFETSLPPPPLPVDGDPAKLTQAIAKLIDNAVKYSRPGGRVQLRAALEAREVVVVVSDEGRGIAPEFLPHVFEVFSQSDHSLTRSEGGLGIGLAFVRHLVGLHGGQASASSEGVDRGAEFVVRLPRAGG
jgi:PAS domain S-box-containing protein